MQWRGLPPCSPTPAVQSKASRFRADLAVYIWLIGQLADAARHIDAAIAWAEAQSPRDELGLAIWYRSELTSV